MPSDSLTNISSRIGRVPLGATALRPRRQRGDLVKRAFDLGFALAIAPIVLPIIALLWLCIRAQGGPGFFRHQRIGQDGRSFGCLKLRSMVPDAEARLAAHLAADPAARAEWERDVKLRHDPRVTPFGRFLRRSSLDELPQIFNVLAGSMSFVGPRPVPADELARYGAMKGAYLSQKPGITGLWQVMGRNDLDYADRVRLDGLYAARRSFWFDLGIILRTVSVVLRRTGC